MPSANSTTDSISITEDKVYYTLSSVDPTKATSIDGISLAVIKKCASVLTKPLYIIIFIGYFL